MSVFAIAAGMAMGASSEPPASAAPPPSTPRPSIENHTRIHLACDSSGPQDVWVEHRSQIAGSGVQTELRYRIPNAAVLRPTRRWMMDTIELAPGKLPLLRTIRSGASPSEQPVAALAFTLDAGELKPGATASGRTEYSLADFAPGVTVVVEFSEVAVEAGGCA